MKCSSAVCQVLCASLASEDHMMIFQEKISTRRKLKIVTNPKSSVKFFIFLAKPSGEKLTHTWEIFLIFFQFAENKQKMISPRQENEGFSKELSQKWRNDFSLKSWKLWQKSKIYLCQRLQAAKTEVCQEVYEKSSKNIKEKSFLRTWRETLNWNCVT